MKILVTGANGFLGKHLVEYLSPNHEVSTISRTNCDLTDENSVDKYFLGKAFDLLLHCAVVGGYREDDDNFDVFSQNLKINLNLLKHKNKFSKIIHFNSGASSLPSFYGQSKRINSEIVNLIGGYNWKIFNCFGLHESENRFIKGSIIKYLKKEPIIIHQNRFMDFFYVEDVGRLIEQNVNQDLDLVYKRKYNLFEIANIINNLDTHKVDIIIENNYFAPDYVGKNSIKLDYIGAVEGIQKMYKTLKNEYYQWTK